MVKRYARIHRFLQLCLLSGIALPRQVCYSQSPNKNIDGVGVLLAEEEEHVERRGFGSEDLRVDIEEGKVYGATRRWYY